MYSPPGLHRPGHFLRGSRSRKSRLVASAGLLFFLVPGGHNFFRSLQHPLVPRRPIIHFRRKRPYHTKRKRQWYKKYSEKATSPKKQKEKNEKWNEHVRLSGACVSKNVERRAAACGRGIFVVSGSQHLRNCCSQICHRPNIREVYIFRHSM